MRSLLVELVDRVAALEAAAAAPAPPAPTPDHLGDATNMLATDNGLLRCYAAAAGEAIAHHMAGLQEAMEAGRRAIYDLGRQHGAAQAIQEAEPAAAAPLTPPPALDGFVDQLESLFALWFGDLRPCTGYTPLARDVICVLADWLELRGNHGSAAELRQESDR
jgi:hypothetical protein